MIVNQKKKRKSLFISFLKQEQKAEKRRRIEENRNLTSHSDSKTNEEQSLVSDDVR